MLSQQLGSARSSPSQVKHLHARQCSLHMSPHSQPMHFDSIGFETQRQQVKHLPRRGYGKASLEKQQLRVGVVRAHHQHCS